MGVGLLTWAGPIELGRLVTREIRLPIARWPEALGPLRIAAIAHGGAPMTGR